MKLSSFATILSIVTVPGETRSFTVTNTNTHIHIRNRSPNESTASITSTSSSSSSSSLSSTPTAVTTVTTEDVVAAPKMAWDGLKEELKLASVNPEEEQDNDTREPEPLLTFYRDTNGWCPFCERIWVAIRAKNIPYQERLISLFDKPEWYKELVPTTQVPAVLFHNPTSLSLSNNNDDNNEPNGNGNGNASANTNTRKLVWESLDILKALDDEFPSTPRLVLDTPEYKAASDQNAKLGTAGVGFVYTTDLSDEESEEKKATFLKALDEMEDALVASGGPFRLGEEFTGVDAELVPTLERWRWQMPLSKGFDILEGRPAMQRWFDAMDEFTPYSERVAGDAYSWTCTAAMFARYFNKEDNPKTQATIERSDAAAARLVETFRDVDASECEARFAFEAAQKIISNYEAIVNDCTNQNPVSQQHIGRSGNKENAETVLQYVTSILLKGDGAIEYAQTSDLRVVGGGKMTDEDKLDAALAAKTVASRLCVPRDMSAPAAKILRAVLTIVAERLTTESSV